MLIMATSDGDKDSIGSSSGSTSRPTAFRGGWANGRAASDAIGSRSTSKRNTRNRLQLLLLLAQYYGGNVGGVNDDREGKEDEIVYDAIGTCSALTAFLQSLTDELHQVELSFVKAWSVCDIYLADKYMSCSIPLRTTS